MWDVALVALTPSDDIPQAHLGIMIRFLEQYLLKNSWWAARVSIPAPWD